MRGHLGDVQHAVDLLPRQAEQAAGEVEILEPTELRVEALRLQQCADLACRAEAIPGDVDAGDPRLPAVRLQQAEQQLDGGGLARAVAAEEAVDAAFGHGHGDRVDSQLLAEAAGQALGFDGGMHGGLPGNLSLG